MQRLTARFPLLQAMEYQLLRPSDRGAGQGTQNGATNGIRTRDPQIHNLVL